MKRRKTMGRIMRRWMSRRVRRRGRGMKRSGRMIRRQTTSR